MIEQLLGWFNEQEVALQLFLVAIASTIISFLGLAFISLMFWIV